MRELVSLAQVEQEPKIDLHRHLDGALSADTIWEISQKHGIPIPGLPEQTSEALKAVYPDPGPFRAGEEKEFNRFLALFGRAIAVMLTPQTIYESTLDAIRDLKRENIVYAELRFNPSFHMGQDYKEYSMQQMIEAVLRAMKEGETETGVSTRLIVGIPRHIAYDPAYQGPSAEEIVRAALEFQNEGVVAIDLNCNEHQGPEPYVDAFRLTVGERLKRTVHAGETGERQRANMSHAIREMQANGIGHALALKQTPLTLATIKGLGIRIERAPVSNQIMGVGNGDFDDIDHLIKLGILVSVNSDDPGIFGPSSTLSQNLLAVANRFQLGMPGIRQLTRNAAESAFLDERDQDELIESLEY